MFVSENRTQFRSTSEIRIVENRDTTLVSAELSQASSQSNNISSDDSSVSSDNQQNSSENLDVQPNTALAANNQSEVQVYHTTNQIPRDEHLTTRFENATDGHDIAITECES